MSGSKVAVFLRRFLDDTKGSVAVESIIMLPVLFWALLATYAFTDAFRQASLNVKASYTVGDLLSRETNYITSDYLSTTHDLFDLMTNSRTQSKLRVTVVRWNADKNIYQRDWSKTKGGVAALTNTDVKNLAAKLPDMPHNERVIVVETWGRYRPPFKVGLEEQDLYNFAFTRPRFAPQLLWQDS